MGGAKSAEGRRGELPAKHPGNVTRGQARKLAKRGLAGINRRDAENAEKIGRRREA
jgi:hypothetical protein